jgi:hypothetical protein
MFAERIKVVQNGPFGDLFPDCPPRERDLQFEFRAIDLVIGFSRDLPSLGGDFIASEHG